MPVGGRNEDSVDATPVGEDVPSATNVQVYRILRPLTIRVNYITYTCSGLQQQLAVADRSMTSQSSP